MFVDHIDTVRISNIISAFQGGADNQYLCFLTTDDQLWAFDFNTFGFTSQSPISLSNEYKIGCFISSTVVALFSTVTNIPTLVNVSTGAETTLSSQSRFAYSTLKVNQTIAGDAANGQALACTSTAGSILTMTTSASGTIAPSGLSTKTFSTVVHKAGTNDFLVGTTTGEVYELEFDGTINKTITLPTGPNVGSAVSHPVASIVLAGDDLYVATATGFLFHYTYSSSTLLGAYLNQQSEAITSGAYICSLPVNSQWLESSRQMRQYGNGISLRLSGSNPLEIDRYYHSDASGEITTLGLNAEFGLGWVAFKGSGGPSATANIKIFKMSGLTSSAPPTRSKPPPTDIAHRLIRIGHYGGHLYRVESDATRGPGSEAVPMTVNDAEAIDLSLIGTPGVDESFGFRRLQA